MSTRLEDLILPPNDAPAQFKEFVLTHLNFIAAAIALFKH